MHRRYNPEGVTQYNIVPGLIGTILTMTMVMMTALAVTRENERGTMENLLATPVRPIEELQAMQMGFFFFLPSILLSGFMFPFRGVPQWAQWLGEILPLTHFLRILRGILLKGNTLADIAPNLWPIAAFMPVVAVIALKRYRETLD